MHAQVNSARTKETMFGRKALSWKQSPAVQYSKDKRYHLDFLKIVFLRGCSLVLVKRHARGAPNMRITMATPFLRTSSMLYQTARIGKRYTSTPCVHFVLVESRTQGPSTAVRRVFGLLPIPEVRSEAKRALSPGECCRKETTVRRQ